MADMRLIVTGAAGRMGRMLIKAIAETPGVTLAAAIERRRGGARRRTPACSPASRAARGRRSPTIRCR